MALKTFVQVNGIQNLADARYCAGMGVNILGFDVDSHTEKYISAEEFKEITGWLSGVTVAGVTSRNSSEDIDEILAAYPLDYIQIHTAAQLQAVRNKQIHVLFKIDLDLQTDFAPIVAQMQQIKEDVAFFIFESRSGEELSSLNPTILSLAQDFPILVGKGFLVNVEDLVQTTSIGGICLREADRQNIGLDDFDVLASMLEKLETEEF